MGHLFKCWLNCTHRFAIYCEPAVVPKWYRENLSTSCPGKVLMIGLRKDPDIYVLRNASASNSMGTNCQLNVKEDDSVNVLKITQGVL